MYVPILKGKEGEFAALEQLTLDAKAFTRPLIEIPAVPFDFAAGRHAKTLDKHIETLPERINRSLGQSYFYLETPFFGNNDQTVDERCAMQVLLDGCGALGMRPIPVLSTSSSVDCRNAVKASLGRGQSFCLRLTVEDFAEDAETDVEVDTVLGHLELDSAKGCDLVVDLGELKNDGATSLLLARSVLASLPRRDEWRLIVIAAASFPEDLSGVNSSSSVVIPRREWTLWQALQRKPKLIPENLVFGDYAISNPLIRGLDPRIMRMSASIRYTLAESWLIIKGRNVGQYGFDQYFDLCRKLVNRPEYLGRQYSWGDDFIWRCAHDDSGPGNATTWRKVGVNHHITVVQRQLAN